MLKPLAAEKLVPGMYVNQVIEQTGRIAIRSKGIVKTQHIIDELLKRGVQVVEIDTSKGVSDEPQTAVEEPTVEQVPPASTSEALNQANTLYNDAVNVQSGFLSAIQKGTSIKQDEVSQLSQSIIESVFDNTDAMCCLAMIKDADRYMMEHSINCAILMAMFCEAMGYDRETTDQACLGALLMDVGMTTVPEELYHSPNSLSKADWHVIEGHVAAGVETVEQFDDISDLVLTIIQQHHERVDGSGYPHQLSGEDISELAKMTAIIDTFDAMITERPHRPAIAPAMAMKRLTKEPGLDQTLVARFIQCIGLYPTGSLVQLKSGKLGIVSKVNRMDMLNPVVMTFYSVNANHYSEIKRLDLATVDDEILSSINPGDFRIDLPKFFRDVFINQVPNS